MRLILLIVLLFGCVVKPAVVSVKDPVPIEAPSTPKPIEMIVVPSPHVELPRTPTREMGPLQKDMMEYTVAFVKVDKDNDVVPYCSGIWVSENKILLAAHCLKEKPDKEKPFNQSPVGKIVSYTVHDKVHEVLDKPVEIYSGQVLAYDDTHDLAMVVGDEVPVHRFVSLAMEMPAIGEMVYMVGHPSFLYWSFIEGIVSSYRYNSSSGRVIQVNSSIWYGNSGGGLFDGNGQLLGICSRIIEGPHMSYFIHLDHIKRFMELHP